MPKTTLSQVRVPPPHAFRPYAQSARVPWGEGRAPRPPDRIVAAPETPRRNSGLPRRLPPDIARALTEIDGHVRRVAVTNEPGSDLNVLAYAIHNLITVVERLHRSS